MECMLPTGDSSSPKVTLPCGKMVGRARETAARVEFVSFTRIPYAKPPVGRLRFRKPEPLDPLSSQFRAKRKCSKPMQLNKFVGNRQIGQEDCLHLNVYAPDLPVTENQNRLPVIMWLFDGDFIMGDASEDLLFPEHLMNDGEVVVVTVNYRVGPFGWLCLENEKAPGNLALWDQNMALRWVNANILGFGGDPNNVTLVGEGSGAVCASYHLLSPQSAGLFHRVICMSGSFATLLHHSDKKPETLARAYAIKMGCAKSDNVDEILVKLQAKSAVDLVRETGFLQGWSSFVPNPWVPVVDGSFAKDAFIPSHPFDILAKGSFNKMPVMFGSSHDEGIYYTAPFIRNPGLWHHLNENWALLGSQLLFNRSPDEFDEADEKILEKVKEFYLGNSGEFNDDNIDKIVQMFGDAITFGANEFMCKGIQAFSAQPIYQYSFDYFGSWRFGDLVVLPDKNVLPRLLLDQMGMKVNGPHRSHGVCHGDDHFYIFSSRLPMLKSLISKEEDVNVARKVVRLITNFAKTSSPTPRPDDSVLHDTTWEPVKGEDRPYLSIMLFPEVKYYNEDEILRSQFWLEIIKGARRTKSDSLPSLGQDA